ncbi:hypothetical protein [Streptomyces sp. NPDC001422]|uniref:hypothetical protein n=1 Tax=Streptomyces sp. NPDC001422 TaxID=3364575 RepID=UPI003679881B
MSTDDLIRRIRSATPRGLIDMLYDARTAMLKDEWAQASQAAMEASPEDSTYDDAGHTVWFAVEGLIKEYVENTAEGVAEDNALVEVRVWRAARRRSPLKYEIGAVPVEELHTEEQVRDAVEEAAMDMMQTAIAHAAGGMMMKESLTAEQYALLTGFLPGSDEAEPSDG